VRVQSILLGENGPARAIDELERYVDENRGTKSFRDAAVAG